MVKIYNRIYWENYPSTKTKVNDINLNIMDHALDELDNSIVELDTKKAEQSTVLNTVQDWSLDEDSGIITITKVNGEQIMFDLNIEKIPVKFELSEDGILTMTTEDGSKFTANIGAMIPVIVFENSDTISVTKISNRTELATNFSKYVHEFESAFTGNIVVKVVPLGDSTGQYNATLVYENGTMDIKSGGGVDEEEFVFAVESLSKITVSSLTSNNIVALYAEVVTNEIRYRFDVKEGSIKDKHLEPNYLAKIKVQAENAELSATASAESATTASEKAIVAESYAVGGTGTREGEDTDNAKYYAELAKELKESFEFPVSIENGGTGATTVREAEYNIHSDIEERTYTLTDDLYTTCLRKEPNATNGTFVKIKLTLLWNYIKSKAESIFATKTEVAPVANLITTVAGKPLDATMGKELADMVATIPTITFATEEPDTVPENTIVMVYEE